MPSKRKRHVPDESWVEVARRNNTDTMQIQQQARPAHRAVFIEDIVYMIIDSLALLPDDERQRTLWSCALVSRTWSDAAMRMLYRSPALTTSNIDSFARTISSGSRKKSHPSARIARLKQSVRHLKVKEADQKAINSTLRRVLDQLSNSLQSYESSAVIVNKSILSSLSRCTNLQSLDLTANQRELNFLDILVSTATLPKLETLKLPQNSFEYQRRRLQGSVDLRWPPALRHLQLPTFFNWNYQSWAIPVDGGWPKTLKSLTILHCTSFWPLANAASTRSVRTPHIESFEIRDCDGSEIRLSLHRLFTIFPNLRTLKLPAEAALYHGCVETMGDIKTTHIEELELHPPSDLYHDRWNLTPVGSPASLEQYVQLFPSLRRLIVPDGVVYSERRDTASLYYAQGVEPTLVALNKLLQDRSAEEQREDSGLFMNGEGRPATIDDEIRRCGMIFQANAASRSAWPVKGVRRWAPQPQPLLDVGRMSSRYLHSARWGRVKPPPTPA